MVDGFHRMSAGVYYNEIDKYCVQWLKNLIHSGHLPKGEVDDRDIKEIKPYELQGFVQHHFFAGIGGWPLALELSGWPANRPVWTGSCPCQPFSIAGLRKGAADKRHLWPDFLRLISECNPPVVFGEQVASKDGRKWLSRVRSDLESLGYGVGCADLCAAGVGSPHIRQRLWWVGESADVIRMDDSPDARCSRERIVEPDSEAWDETRVQKSTGRSASGWLANSEQQGLAQREGYGRLQQEEVEPYEGEAIERRSDSGIGFWDVWEAIPCADGKFRRVEPGTFPLAHGVPSRVGKIRAYGNAVVPQVAAEFIKAYMESSCRT